jgi:hypothetical protein
MDRLQLIIERSKSKYSAHSPDMPGWVASHRSMRGLKVIMKPAIVNHVAAMTEQGTELVMPDLMIVEIDKR